MKKIHINENTTSTPDMSTKHINSKMTMSIKELSNAFEESHLWELTTYTQRYWVDVSLCKPLFMIYKQSLKEE